MYDIPYASRYDVQVNIPANDLPKDGVESNVVYQMLHDELTLDGNPNLNLASFVHTWVPDGECTAARRRRAQQREAVSCGSGHELGSFEG